MAIWKNITRGGTVYFRFTLKRVLDIRGADNHVSGEFRSNDVLDLMGASRQLALQLGLDVRSEQQMPDYPQGDPLCTDDIPSFGNGQDEA